MHWITYVAVLFLVVSSCPSFEAARTEPTGPENQQADFTGGLSPTIFVLISVLAVAMLLVVFAAAYVLCYHMMPPAEPPLRVLQPLPASAAREIDTRAVQTFPMFVYADLKGLKMVKGALECAVCLSEFEDHETLRLLPRCHHVFHTHCIGAWLGSHTTCPVCRSRLVDEPAVERTAQTATSRIEP